MRKKLSNRAKLKKLADKLYQIKLIKLKPKSIISGEPTEVIHHFINKGKSNNLRYDEKNGVPLTRKEHTQHHRSGDPAIVATIVMKMGEDWFNDLQARRRILKKLNITELKEIIRDLESKL